MPLSKTSIRDQKVFHGPTNKARSIIEYLLLMVIAVLSFFGSEIIIISTQNLHYLILTFILHFNLLICTTYLEKRMSSLFYLG